MANFRQMRDRLKAFKLDEAIMRTMTDESTAILNANRKQLKKGFKSTGERVGVYANPAYERMKRQMNPEAGGWVDLTLTGDFTEEFTLRPETKSRAVIYSQDEKARALAAKYGKDIYGLSPESVGDVIESGFQRRLVQNTKEALDL